MYLTRPVAICYPPGHVTLKQPHSRGSGRYKNDAGRVQLFFFFEIPSLEVLGTFCTFFRNHIVYVNQLAHQPREPNVIFQLITMKHSLNVYIF